MSLLDHALLAELAELLGPQLAPILATFRTQATAYQEELVRAEATGDLESVRRTAHALKGASASVGATGLHDAMQGLEHAARDGDATAVREGLATMPALLHATLEALPAGG